MLFDEITRLPEYYPTRAERAILNERADEIAGITGADTLVELGSGTSEKTRLLLDALSAAGTLRQFVAFDVDESVLLGAAEKVNAEYPVLAVHAVVGDFERHLRHLPTGGRRLVAFLGGTIGNFQPNQRGVFLSELRAGMADGDWLLLGTDLVKDPARLIAAYDDSAGVTAAFNRNVLTVINRELDANLDPRGFAHVARWDPDAEWIEMRLRSTRDQAARVGALDLDVTFARDEQMRTEISAKFRRARVESELADAGLRLSHWWTDPAGDFALSLSTPA
jgi:L-histidine N-alpha-methyltransferase